MSSAPIPPWLSSTMKSLSQRTAALNMPSSPLPTAAALVLATLFFAARSRRRSYKMALQTVSPLETTLPRLTAQERAELDYPPDYLPGAREVDTPYGKIRVYEFGPETGEKVLLVHGISAPSVGLADFAKELVKRGCRVMMFDLYGRGWSSAPVGVQHTSALYMTEVLSVLGSSKLSWTGINAFSLVGYSMGGAISANFCSMFPLPVKSLVLMCPAGLIRQQRLGKQQRLMAILSMFPKFILRILVRRFADRTNPNKQDPEAGASSDGENIDKAAVQRVFNAVKWQIDNHPGFIDAFISSIMNAPLAGQHENWKRIGRRLDAMKQNKSDGQSRSEGLIGGKVVLFLAKDDVQIVQSEIEPDIKKALGEDNVELQVFPGGHELPVALTSKVVEELWNRWMRWGVVNSIPARRNTPEPDSPSRIKHISMLEKPREQWPSRTSSLAEK